MCLSVRDNFLASDWSKFGDLARRRETSHDVARLLLMVPLEPWQNSTPFFGAAAFCTTKIGDFRTSSTLSSLMTLVPFFMIEGGDGNSRYSHSVEAVARKGRASLPAKVGIPHFFSFF